MRITVDGGSLPPDEPSVPKGDAIHASWIPHDKALEQLDFSFHMKNKWEREFMDSIRKISELGTYKEMGHESVEDFVAARYGLGYMRACEFVGVAVCVKELPKIESAYERGEVSYDHLRALVQVANQENEEDLLQATSGMTVADTFRLVGRIKDVSKEDSVDSRAQRMLRMRWHFASRMLELHGLFPEDMGALLEKSIDHVAKKLPDDPTLGSERTPMMVRRADALCELVSTSGGSSPRTQVVVHVDAEALASGQGVGELQGGPSVSIETVKRLSCDSSIQTVADDKDGKPVASSRSRRFPTARQRRDLARRDQGCRWPGCRRRKVVDAHHIQHHQNGGETELHNLVLMCKLHHYLVHEAGYVVVGQPPNIEILGPHGEVIRNGPPPMTPEARASFESERDSKDPPKPRGPDQSRGGAPGP